MKTILACKLSGPEFRARKASILAELKDRMRGKKELSRGYAYDFDGSADMLGILVAFVLKERECCSFLDYNLRIKGDGSTIRLAITGPEGAKGFLAGELGLG